MSIYELARKYYPRLWGIERLSALLEAGKLAQEEFDVITAEEAGEVSG